MSLEIGYFLSFISSDCWFNCNATILVNFADKFEHLVCLPPGSEEGGNKARRRNPHIPHMPHMADVPHMADMAAGCVLVSGKETKGLGGGGTRKAIRDWVLESGTCAGMSVCQERPG